MVLYSRCAQLRWNFLVLYLEWRFLAYAWNEPSWFRTWNRGSLACFISCSLCLACYVAIEATWYKFIDDNRIFSFFFFLKWTLNLKYFFSGFYPFSIPQFSSVQSLSCVLLFVTPWIAAHQASLSITNSQSSLKLMSIESVMPSSHLILCRPLFLLPPIPPSIRVFSSESTLHMKWPKYWSFSFSSSPSNERLGLVSFRMD